MTVSVPPPDLLPFNDLGAAIQAALAHLQRTLGFQHCLFTHVDKDLPVRVAAHQPKAAYECGKTLARSERLHARLLRGEGPLVLAGGGAGACAGVPILGSDGRLFGTICGLCTQAQEIDHDEAAAVLLLFGRLLGSLVDRQREVDEAERRAERAEADALLDPLTGVFNRRGWDRLLAGEEERCRRYDCSAHIFMLDLDEFKHTNDTYGHARGDRMLRHAARTITRVLRGHDSMARIGGDEFAILAVESEPAQAEHLRRRLLDAFRERGIAASIGVARRRAGATLRRTWEEADALMYEAKRRHETGTA
ncbi:GGDEF domain-containing protein [bacterium]|nr:MAG: GGDEF domain-containing protein [bacterium]